eukprot:4322572-Amphidinium_carterae.2
MKSPSAPSHSNHKLRMLSTPGAQCIDQVLRSKLRKYGCELGALDSAKLAEERERDTRSQLEAALSSSKSGSRCVVFWER